MNELGLVSPHKILFVDDEQDVLDAFERRLRRNYNVVTACGGEDAIKKMQSKGPFAVIISDMRMPKMTGLQLLKSAKKMQPHVVRIMLTGNTDQKTAIDAVNDGEVFKFLTKPCGSKTLGEVLDSALQEYERRTVERNMLNGTVKQIIQLLCSVLSQGDPDTWNSGLSAMRLLKQLSEKLEIVDSWPMEMAALLARLGVITIPWELRHKWENGEKLSESEKELIDKIPETGYQLLKSVPKLDDVASLVRYHQKYYDGSGYPEDGLKGEDIPQGASIVRLVFDFVEWQNKGKSNRECVKILKSDSHLYDPVVFKALEELFPGRAQQVKQESEQKLPEIKEISAKQLAVGMLLADDIVSSKGAIVIKGKTVVDEVCLNKLLNFMSMEPVKEPLKIIVKN